MSVSRISRAMNFIDDELISEAESYKPKRNIIVTSIKFTAVALAACLVLAMIFHPQAKHDSLVMHTDATLADAEVMYAGDIKEHKVFGKYFPTVYADNYHALYKVYIYDNRMEAEFFNIRNYDTIQLIIFPKEYLSVDETMGAVIYPENENPDFTSYILVDMGDYVARYSSENKDLATVAGFEKMIESTKQGE